MDLLHQLAVLIFKVLGQITAGIITATSINVGVGSTAISLIEDRIGFGTATPREKVDMKDV